MGNCAGTSVDPPNPDYVDLTHFELLKVVGKGGFGKVNAITQLSSQELLALKRIEKSRIIKSKSHLNMVWTERKIMSIVHSPFLCHLRYAFESDTELFLVMPFLQGGDLRFHLKERGRMREETAKFYAAQIVLGLEELHSHWIVYRDLKPENVLLDAKGNVQITDFGLAFMLKDDDKRRTRGQAGTRGYMAPETMGVRGYGLSVDYFSLGVMLYELLHGVRPWKNIDTSMAMMGLEGEIDPLAAVRNHKKDVEKEMEEAVRGMGGKKESVTATQHKRDPSHSEEEEEEDKPDVIRFSSRLTEDAKSLLLSLLEFNPNKRLGCLAQQSSSHTPQQGWSYVKSHPWFGNIDWAAMQGGLVTPPFTPDVTHANCTPDADLADQLLDKKPKRIRDDEQKLFEGWSWNTTVNKDGNAAAAMEGAEGEAGKMAEEGKRRGGDIDRSVGAREGKVRGRDEEEEEKEVEMADEEVRSFEVRKEAENEYEEKSFDDGTIAAVSMSEQLPNYDSHNSSSMTAEDRREEKKDTLPPLHSSFLPPPSSTTTHSSLHVSTASHASLSISAPEPSDSSAAYSTSPPRTPPLPLVIIAADSIAPTSTAAAVAGAGVSTAAHSLVVADVQTATTPIHLPVTPLSPPPSHHRASSSTSSSSSASLSSAHLLPSSSSSASIHLAFATPLTSLPGSSRPSITSTQASSSLTHSTHTTHRQSHSTGQLSLPHDRDEPSPVPSESSSVGLSVPTGSAAVLSGERQERRSTLKEKRELKPIVAAEHTRTSSTPNILPAAAM